MSGNEQKSNLGKQLPWSRYSTNVPEVYMYECTDTGWFGGEASWGVCLHLLTEDGAHLCLFPERRGMHLQASGAHPPLPPKPPLPPWKNPLISRLSLGTQKSQLDGTGWLPRGRLALGKWCCVGLPWKLEIWSRRPRPCPWLTASASSQGCGWDRAEVRAAGLGTGLLGWVPPVTGAGDPTGCVG